MVDAKENNHRKNIMVQHYFAFAYFLGITFHTFINNLAINFDKLTHNFVE